jgi:hypothetical protein
MKIEDIALLKKLLKKSMLKRSVKNFSGEWFHTIKEAQGIIPKTHWPPHGYRGPTNQRMYNRALLYKNRIQKGMKKQNYNKPLYRGIRGWEVNQFMNAINRDNKTVHKKTLSSFTKNLHLTTAFGTHILVINKPTNLLSINLNSNKFHSQRAIEKEVILPPGRFKITNVRGHHIYVNFNPNI